MLAGYRGLGLDRPENHLARHSERGNKTRQTEEEVGRQHQGIDRLRVRQVPEGSGEKGKKWRKLVAKSSVKITTLVVKGKMRRERDLTKSLGFKLFWSC